MKTLTLIILLASSFGSQAKVVEQVLATVEGKMILQSELQSFKQNVRSQNLVDANLIQLYSLSQNPSDKAALSYLVSKKLIVHQGLKDQGLSSSQEVAEKEVANLAKQNRISVSKLKRETQSRGLNFSKYKNFIGESALVRSTLERHVMSKVRPSEEDFVTYLRSNGLNIKSSYQYTLEQIFIPSSASSLLSKITASSFKAYFKDAEKLKLQAFSLGKLKAQELSKTHQKALEGLSSGEITTPIKEKNGHRIFYVKAREGGYKIPNTPEVKGLQKKFFDGILKEQFKTWLSSLQNSYFVKYNL